MIKMYFKIKERKKQTKSNINISNVSNFTEILNVFYHSKIADFNTLVT